MSRSRKKHAIIKDNNKFAKKLSNKRLRRRTKAAIDKGKDTLPIKNEVINQYDVCDYISIANKEDDNYNKFKRK